MGKHEKEGENTKRWGKLKKWGGLKKEEWLKIRVCSYELELWKEAAGKEKKSLSKFARIAINSRTKYTLNKSKMMIKIITKDMNRPRTNKRPRTLMYN